MNTKQKLFFAVWVIGTIWISFRVQEWTTYDILLLAIIVLGMIATLYKAYGPE